MGLPSQPLHPSLLVLLLLPLTVFLSPSISLFANTAARIVEKTCSGSEIRGDGERLGVGFGVVG